MPSASRIAHAGLPFANPMSQLAVDAAIAALPLPTGALVVDTGCGGGEILLRTLELHSGTRGVGVDLDADAIAEARQRTMGRPARFEVRDAATVEGTFDAVINVASSQAHRGLSRRRWRHCGPWDGCVLDGEGFWRRPPSEDALRAALGGADPSHELSDYDGLRAAIGDAGLDVVQESVASEDDWARYEEETLAANAERHGTPPTPSPTRAGSAIGAHCPGATDTLGFALFALRA